MKEKAYVAIARLLVAIDNCKRSVAQALRERGAQWAENADIPEVL